MNRIAASLNINRWNIFYNMFATIYFEELLYDIGGGNSRVVSIANYYSEG